MNGGHPNMEKISDYLTNRLSIEEEISVQEHLHSCSECMERVRRMRLLRDSIFNGQDKAENENIFIRIVKSTAFKAAAVVVILAGITLFIRESLRNSEEVTIQYQIFQEREQIAPPLYIDTFSTEDPLYYIEQYGEEFEEGK
ncbi:MAG: anti-sigma factor family protein [Candidatus Coprenecus sp.]